MNNHKVLLPAFILLALVQLYVPASMILAQEKILKYGKEYKFKTAPIDPNDPFRGKYITLNYEDNTIKIPKESNWERGEVLYAVLKTDDDGFAKIQSVSKERPTGNPDFLKTKASYVSAFADSSELTIEYAFDRFYMEESKAPAAEQAYMESSRDARRSAYALVNIKDGEAVLKDVLIDGISIREIVKENKRN